MLLLKAQVGLHRGNHRFVNKHDSQAFVSQLIEIHICHASVMVGSSCVGWWWCELNSLT